MEEITYAFLPVLILLLGLGFCFAVWRFLLSGKCWRCGTGFDRFAHAKSLFGIIPRTYCRRCGAKSIRLV